MVEIVDLRSESYYIIKTIFIWNGHYIGARLYFGEITMCVILNFDPFRSNLTFFKFQKFWLFWNVLNISKISNKSKKYSNIFKYFLIFEVLPKWKFSKMLCCNYWQCMGSQIFIGFTLSLTVFRDKPCLHKNLKLAVFFKISNQWPWSIELLLWKGTPTQHRQYCCKVWRWPRYTL